MSLYARRIEKVRKAIESDAILVLPAQEAKIRNRDTHFSYRAHSHTIYLTGINEEELSLIISHDELHVFAQIRNPERERWVGRVQGHDYFLSLFSELSGKVILHDSGDFIKSFGELAKGKKKLYYDFGEHVDYDRKFLGALNEIANFSRKGIFAPRTITRASEILNECRIIKDDFDLDQMRQAAAISVRAHNAVRERILAADKPISEILLKAEIENAFMAGGAPRLAYPSIVAAHENATILHYEGSSGSAKPGEFVLIDAGAEFQGFASDITRTTCVGGAKMIPGLNADLYNLVLASQQAAIAKSVAGTTIENIHETAVDILCDGLLEMGFFKSVPQRKKDLKTEKIEEVEGRPLIQVNSREEIKALEYYNLFYMHRTSHYLGLDVHDVGDYYHNFKSRALVSGMVITVEPGLYFPNEYEFLRPEARGIGIRIEDDVLVTATGNEVLSAGALK